MSHLGHLCVVGKGWFSQLRSMASYIAINRDCKQALARQARQTRQERQRGRKQSKASHNDRNRISSLGRFGMTHRLRLGLKILKK